MREAPAETFAADESHRSELPAPSVRYLPKTLEVQHVRVDRGGTHLLGAVQLVQDGATAAAGGSTASGGSAPGSGEPDELLVYSNTLGRVALGFGPFARLSDDIHLTVASGAVLSRFNFVVDGAINGGFGAFNASFGLYDACPGFRGELIEGTSGTAELPDNGTYLVEFVPDVDIPLPDVVWLSVRLSRSGAGWVAGAPPLVGYSDNFIDYTLFGCEVEFAVTGIVHSSFSAEIFVRPPVEPQFFGYRARTRPAERLLPQPGDRYADDLTIGVDDCLLTSYEVGLRGDGDWQVDLREDDGGVPGKLIPGSEGVVTTSGNAVVNARFPLDPPVPIGKTIWLTVAATGVTPNLMQAELPANVGSGTPLLLRQNGDGWEEIFGEGEATIRASLRCAGEAPVGACCDMEFLAPDGDPVCRQVPQSNCPFPRWVESAACVPEPFSPPCGAAACCLANGLCANRTTRRCEVGGQDWYRDFVCGDELPRDCPAICPVSEGACSFAHEGVGCRDADCCRSVCEQDIFCCNTQWDEFCAQRAHGACARPPSNDSCETERPRQDGAKSIRIGETLVADLQNATTRPQDPGFCCHGGFGVSCEGGCNDGLACDDSDDCPGAADGICNVEGRCEGGCEPGSACDEDADCTGTAPGVCPSRVPLPGQQAAASSWFGLTLPSDRAEPLSVEISTCGNDPPADDSMIAVWAVDDPDRGVCDRLGRCLDGSACEIADDICPDGSLCRESVEACSRSADDCPAGRPCVMDLAAACSFHRPLACADDSPTCGARPRTTALCLPDLEPGAAMLIQIGAKTAASRGSYNLAVDEVSSCDARTQSPKGSACDAPLPLQVGTSPLDIALEAFQCVYGDCGQTPARAVWLRMTAEQDGEMVLTADLERTADRVSVEWFGDCDCGAAMAAVGCTTMLSTDRIVARRRVAVGECNLIRLEADASSALLGTVRAEFASGASCPPTDLALRDPPSGVTDARRPGQPGELLFRRLRVGTKPGAAAPGGPACWRVCEPEQVGLPNGVVEVARAGGSEYELRLLRAPAAGAETRLAYRDDFGATTHFLITALPGDVDGNGTSGAPDIIALIDGLRDGNLPLARGDLNRDGSAGPADIITLIDLLNGASGFDPWLGRGALPAPTCGE